MIDEPTPRHVAPPHGRSRRKRLLFRLMAVALVGATSLIGLELGLRLFWRGFYLKATGEHLTHSPTRMWQNTPGWRGELQEPEFLMKASHNSLGLRGPEVAPVKAPGTYRIVALGDSFTYGIGVHDDETFCARLHATDPRLEVVNTGVNNYGTHQELLALQEQGLPLRPDVVLVCVFWNDLGNSYHRREIGYSLRDGELVYEPSPSLKTPRKRSRSRRALLRHSYAYRFLSDRLKTLKHRLRAALDLEDETGDLIRFDTSEPAWALHLALMDEIVRRSREAGARVMVVVIPDQKEVYPDAKVIGFSEEECIVTPRLAAWGKERGVPVIDLVPALRAEAERTKEYLYYPFDRHLVPAGHRVVAEVIATSLYEQGWVPRPAPRTDGADR